MKDQKSGLRIKQLIEGFVALCLGSSDNLVWVDQADAQAFTDGTKVYLPRPQGLEGEQDLLLGIAMREIAKITHSDAAIFTAAQQDVIGYASSIEDARVKQAISAEYKGAASLFDAATAVVHRVAMQSVSGPETDPEQLKQLAIWFAANDALLGTQTTRVASQEINAIASLHLDKTALQQAIGLAQASPFLGTPKASVMCGERIHALLMTSPQDPPPQNDEAASGDGNEQPGQSDQKSTASDGMQDDPSGEQESDPSDAQGSSQEGSECGQPGQEGQDHPSQSGDSAPSDQSEQGPSKGQSQEGSGQGDDSSSTPQNGSAGRLSSDPMSNALAKLKGFGAAREVTDVPQSGNATDTPDSKTMHAIEQALVDENASQKLQEVVAGMAEGQPDSGEDAQPVLLAAASQDDPSVDPMEFLGASSDLANVSYMPQSNALDPIPARLVNVLLREFNDKRQARKQRRDSGCDVDVANLWRLKRLGDTNVFLKKTPTSGVDAAVMILLDVSYSMRASIATAASATHAFALALQRISGVQTAISLFPASPAPTRNILNFRQNLSQAKTKLRDVVVAGGTPTAEAIDDVLPLLMKAQVQKRVLLIITDGKPGDEDKARRSIAAAKLRGIDVIGIGIGAGVGIESIIPDRSVSINTVAELPRALEELFKSKLSASLLAA